MDLDDATVDILGHSVELIRKHVSADEVQRRRNWSIKGGHEPATEYWTYGWKVTIGKDQYGDFLILTEPCFDEAKRELLVQAEMSICLAELGQYSSKKLIEGVAPVGNEFKRKSNG